MVNITERAGTDAAENLMLRLLPSRGRGGTVRYAASGLVVCVAAGLHYALGETLRHFPLLLFYPAVFLCSLLFDRGSGFFATILSALVAAYLFIEPTFSFAIDLQSTIALVIFISIGFSMAAVTEALRKTIARLDQSERAKELLFDELAHRTKNDLMIISSAIQMQSRAAEQAEVRDALDAANARVHVVACAQERLRDVASGARVDLADYITSLCSGLGELLRDVRPIAVRVKCAALDVPSSGAVHVGLIVNELVTNSLKYAYPGERGGIVTVDIDQHDRQLVIVVADNGCGCQGSIVPGLGSKLVRLLAKQMGGSVQQEPVEEGFRTRVILDDIGL